MKQALQTRKITGISRGTYYRILGQAERNVRRSIFTVAIAVQLGLLKVDDLQKLVAMVAKIPDDVDSEKLPELVGLASALAERIVML